MLAVVDYGAGNLKSVKNALDYLRIPSEIITDAQSIKQADGVILPGVGAFGDAAAHLENSGLKEAVCAYIAADRPFLGICIGMQLLFAHSEESPGAQGLHVFDGSSRRFDDAHHKVPHIGWNSLILTDESNPLFTGIVQGSFFYFVHSYYVTAEKRAEVSGRCVYAAEFDCAGSRGNVHGLQFHPEKSGKPGLRILSNFGRIVDRHNSVI